MNNKFILLIALVLTLGATYSYTQEKNKSRGATSGLPAEGQKVVDYLLDDWQKRFRSTSIPLAMDNLGMKANDQLRLKIGQHFRDNTNLANNLMWFGANNYILSNEEKLLAKYLINTYEDENRIPDLQELNKALGISKESLKSRLAFIAKAGLLQESKKEKSGYSLADGYKRWGGPLRHNFHIVSVEGEKPFDVW